MSDPELHRLTDAVDAARGGYQDALMRLVEYGTTAHTALAKQSKADPVTVERVRDAVTVLMQNAHRSHEWSTEQLARWLSMHTQNLPEAKTLMNVYLPAIRDDCPHAVQSGRTWLWFRNAKRGSRDAATASTAAKTETYKVPCPRCNGSTQYWHTGRVCPECDGVGHKVVGGSR